jgi:hypothetical protein
MEHYVTLFDSLFLPQGLALHVSMERYVGNYTLWILCVDDEAHEVLSKLDLPNVRLLQLSKLETPELLAVKPGRSKGEYCWTLTPFTPRFVFEADAEVPRVTYLDADLWFRKNPEPIFREFDASGKDVLITDHAYASEYDQSVNYGQYCVQFMTFTRNAELIRKWWEERCIEWCFARSEDGKFADQKYLDDWPERFAESVHVLQNKELLLAPWNATRFPLGNSVAYHFHAIRILDKSRVLLQGIYRLPHTVIKDIYKPYYADIISSISRLAIIGFEIRAQAKEPKFRDWLLELRNKTIGKVVLVKQKVLRPQWSVNGRTIVKIQ